MNKVSCGGGKRMLTYDEILNMNYYKKTSYTGWMEGMRFLIRRETPEEGDAFFHVYAWPGPYIFSLVEDEKKIDATFPFTEEGRCQCVDWLNEQFTTRTDLWPTQKIAGIWDR